MIGKRQYVFDPEGEYIELIRALKGEVFSFQKQACNFINIMQIFEIDVISYREGTFSKKVLEVKELLIKVCHIDEQEKKEQIQYAILKAYEQKGINEDIKSYYKIRDESNIYIDQVIKSSTEFPILSDILEYISDENLKSILHQNIQERLYFFSNNTNINLKNRMIGFHTNMFEKEANYITQFILLKISDYLKYSCKLGPTIIYIDEIWRYINCSIDYNMSDLIFMLFKTIRKNGGSIVAITQDISDFFSYHNGSYGKSILNNSCFKMFFRMDYFNSEVLKKIAILNETNIEKVLKLDKGECIIHFKNNITTLQIKASQYEEDLMKGVEK